MKNVYFEDFRQLVLQHCREIQAEYPDYQSIEWFLLRYLKKIDKCTQFPPDPGRVESSMRGLVRFYVDMVEEHSVLGERCRMIYSHYRKTLRENRED